MRNFPDSYATTPEGHVMIASGIGPMKIWDGLRAAPIDAGVDPPDTACTIAAGASPGDILGNYAAYVRFVKDDGALSNLSPLSSRVDVLVAGGGIIGATDSDPIEITTSAPHGLTSGDFVDIEGVQGNTASNGTWEVTVTGASTFTLDNSSSDGAYIGFGSWTSGASSVEYTNVPVSADPYVARRQILRNTNRQFTVFYVDVDTDDLTSTSFTSNNSDNELATQTAVPLLSDDGSILAEAHERPPNYQTAIAFHGDRMFAAVNAVYKVGAAVVTNGSTTVTGIGTAWTAAMAGRFIFVDGATMKYAISSVDPAAQTLTLETAYGDSTDNFAFYAIRPDDGFRRLVHYTPAGQPQSWAQTYAIAMQEDGDELSGLLVKGSFIYIVALRHIYRFTYQSDPAVDGAVYQSCQRGAINNRCWVQVESNSIMLDQDGIHAFGGGQESQQLSTPVQLSFQAIDVFNRGAMAINWNCRELFHAAHFPNEEVVRFFVAMGSNNAPRHAIAFHSRTQKWWIEDYPVPVFSSCTAIVKFARIVFGGSEARQTLSMSQGFLDGIDANSGNLYGTITAADLYSITDGGSNFPSNLAGRTLSVANGRGKLQRRVIHSESSGRIKVTDAFSIKPQVGDRYIIAGVHYRYLAASFDWSDGEREMDRRIGISFFPTKAPSTMFLRFWDDYDNKPVKWAVDTLGAEFEGVGAEKNTPYLNIDLTRANGYSQQRVPDRREDNIEGPRALTFELLGVAGQDGVQISAIDLDCVDTQ